MNIKRFIEELKRRNVFKVAIAYAIAGWLAIQVISTISPQLGFPEWIAPFVTVVVLIGFPIALVIAWAFELTPDGLKKSDEVAEHETIAPKTGKKINAIIIASLSLLIIFLLVERFFIADVGTPQNQSPPTTQISKQSVAVLPFADLSENKDQEWFSDGLTEEILNSLAQLPELKVTSRTSAFQFKGKDQDISKIADTLGVAHVVEGSVRRIGDQLRVTAQLIRAEDDYHLWSETYDSSTDNLFEVQTDIAEEIAKTLDVFLDDERRESMFAAGTRNVEAFQEYLKGMDKYREAHSTSNIDDLWTANEYFDRALELDPEFGEASLIKMDAYAHMLVDPGTSSQVMSLEEARTRLVEVLEYGAERIENPLIKASALQNAAFFSDSWYQLPTYTNQLIEALGDQKNVPPASVWNYEILSILGHDETAMHDAIIDLELDPLSLTSWFYRAVDLYKREGLEASREVFAESKNHLGNNLFTEKLEHVYIALEDRNELLASLYPNGVPDFGIHDAYLLQYNAFLAASLGQDQLAEKLLAEYKQLSPFVDDIMVLTLYESGRIEEAKAQIRYIDSLPAGPANLVIGIASLGNRLFFDLEDAPNTAARFREAGIDVSRFKKVNWVE